MLVTLSDGKDEKKLIAFSFAFAQCKCILLLPPANKVWGKVMTLLAWVILFTGGGGLPDRYPPTETAPTEPTGHLRPPWTETPLPPDRDPCTVKSER